MTDPQTTTPAETLGIKAGTTVRLIGGTPELEAALSPLPDRVTLTSLGSESADVGLILVENDADLRERLFTELNGLIGATHVWIIAEAGTEPDEAAIRAEAELVTWHTVSATTVAGKWIAVGVQKS